jgi:hypothetical protein
VKLRAQQQSQRPIPLVGAPHRTCESASIVGRSVVIVDALDEPRNAAMLWNMARPLQSVSV